jgi:hypothetical protein
MNEDKPAAKEAPRSPLPVEEKIGTHPLGATTGAIGGAIAGAVAGLAAGPVGSLVGLVGGAVLGGALGASSDTGPVIDIAAQEKYWCENFESRPYVPDGASFDDYGPAYRYGIQRYVRSDRPREWGEVEPEMAAGWASAKGESRLSWDEAAPAVRDAWERLRQPGEGTEGAW